MDRHKMVVLKLPKQRNCTGDDEQQNPENDTELKAVTAYKNVTVWNYDGQGVNDPLSRAMTYVRLSNVLNES